MYLHYSTKSIQKTFFLISASEYSKVRAQLNVLKKAVIEEQNAKHQVAEALKEHETKNRKVEAEMDALTFRNSQLTRRVEILQQESEQKQQKQKNKHEITNDVNSVISEELSLKIAENAKLHDALNEVDQKYEAKISTLTSTVLGTPFFTKYTRPHPYRPTSQKFQNFYKFFL